MPQKLNAEPVSLMRACDQPRYVGQHKCMIAGLHDSETRFERGEWIIRDLRLGRRKARDQRRLSRVRKSDQSGIREQFQLQSQLEKFTGLAFFMFGGSLVRRGCEPRIAAASPTAVSDGATLSRSRKVEYLLTGFGVVNDRAYRNGHLDRRSIVSRSIAAFTMPAAFSRVFRVEPEMQQRVVVLARDQDNIAPVATVATAWTAARDVLFAAKCETTVAAVASFY